VRILLLLLFCIFVNTANAQIIDSAANNKYFRFIYDNDFFCSTDRYYTQGTIVELIHPIIKKSPLSYLLFCFKNNSQRHYGFSLQQDVFTPKSIRMDTLNKLERPFTATLVMRHSVYSINPFKKQRLNTGFELGIIGPNAKGEETQKGIHKALNNIAPQGWQWQLNQDIIINYNVIYEKGLITKKYAELIWFGGLRAGTLYNDASGGIYFRLGLMNSYFNHFGIIKNAKKNKVQLYLTARAQAKLVAYNATLQGGLFSTSIYEMNGSAVERKVFSVSSGVVLAYKRLSLEYSNYYITKEFNRGIDHGWGNCNITVCF
jgi:hypothetical protein